MIFPFYIFLLLHWWLLFYGGGFKKRRIKTFSQNDTTLKRGWILVYSRGNDQEDWLSAQSVSFLLFKWGWICIVMCSSYFRDEGGWEMRFSDQIDLGNGALRSWQAESERLLFDHSGRSQWGRREHGKMESHCCTPTHPLPPSSPLDHTLGRWGAPSSSLFWPSGSL